MIKITIQKLLRKPVYLGLTLIGVLLLFLVISLISHKGNSNTPQIHEGQIQVVKGDQVITINQNGLVEYKSKDKTYTEVWDATKVSNFFATMDQKARDYLGKRVSGGDCGYKVFMFVDRKLVTICLDSSDKEMTTTVEPVFIKYSDVTVSDFFGNTDNTSDQNTSDQFSGVIDFPTSTPGLTSVLPSPTPTPFSIYNSNTNYAPVSADCDTWSGDIVKNRAIISNTFCTVSSTPTPAL